MRVLPAALALSATLHGGAIAWSIQQDRFEDTEQSQPVTDARAPIEIIPPAPLDPEPMIVALLPDHTVVQPAPVASRQDHRRSPENLSIETRTRTETAAAATTLVSPGATDPGAPGKPRHPLLTMRKPELDAIPRGDFTERFLAASRPLQPKDIKSEQLADDLAAAEARLKNPRWVANATPDQLAGARIDVLARRDELYNRTLQPDGTGTKVDRKSYRVRVAADGTATIEDKANVQRQGLLGASFDVTDAIMRRQGIDPYASAKLRVLDETREERVAIGKRHRTQQLAQSKQIVQVHLERLWSTTTDVTSRKHGLFELWDDCAESGTDDLVAGGAAARDHVVGFIRGKLPAGSADAFTADDLARFNSRRKSRATFAPY